MCASVSVAAAHFDSLNVPWNYSRSSRIYDGSDFSTLVVFSATHTHISHSLFCVYENGIKLQHQFLFYYLLYWHFLPCDAIKFSQHNIFLYFFFSEFIESSVLKCSIGKWIMHILTIIFPSLSQYIEICFFYEWERRWTLLSIEYDNNSCLLGDKESKMNVY